MRRTCLCEVGPWDLHGVCDACGGIDLGLPTLLPDDPPRISFITDDQITERLRSIEADVRALREQLEPAG